MSKRGLADVIDRAAGWLLRVAERLDPQRIQDEIDIDPDFPVHGEQGW